MSYNNYRYSNYQGGNNGFSRAPYRQNGYGGGYGQQWQPQQRQQRKRTGAKSGMGRNNQPYVRGWRVSRRSGLVSYLAVPYGKTHVVESRNGKSWENWMVKVKPQFGPEYLTSGLYSPDTGKVIVSSEGIVINPKAPNGGYCGGFGQRNRR